MACSGGDGDSDPTGPGEFPDVQGSYQRSDVVGAVTCTPQTPPPGGDVQFDAYTLSEAVRITQSGSRVSHTYLSFPDDPPDTGSVDMAGKVKLAFSFSTKENNTRDGRTFYLDVTGTFDLTRLDNGARLSGTGSYVNVFHEGSPTAPVFATCSRTSTVELTRTGD
jgi:hypothetical protein